LISEEIPQKVADDPAYQNARKYSDKQNARIEHDDALRRVIVGLMKDDTDLFRLFSDNPDFKTLARRYSIRDDLSTAAAIGDPRHLGRDDDRGQPALCNDARRLVEGAGDQCQ
jgi:hypothetical protein